MNLLSRITATPFPKIGLGRATKGALVVGAALAIANFSAVRAEDAKPVKVKTVFWKRRPETEPVAAPGN
jgi:hypothetical protein